jgi:hypothetical protein
MNDITVPRQQITTKLYSAVLSDVLDAAGYLHQAMRPFIRPLDDSLVLFGRVRTGLYANSYHVEPDKTRMQWRSSWSTICGPATCQYWPAADRPTGSLLGANC